MGYRSHMAVLTICDVSSWLDLRIQMLGVLLVVVKP